MTVETGCSKLRAMAKQGVVGCYKWGSVLEGSMSWNYNKKLSKSKIKQPLISGVKTFTFLMHLITWFNSIWFGVKLHIQYTN